MRRGGTLHLLLRQARADVPVLVTLGVLVFVTAVLAAAVPRQLDATNDAALRQALGSAPAAALEITATSTNSRSYTQLAQVDSRLTRRMDPVLTQTLGIPVLGASAGLYDTLRPRSEEPFRTRPFAWLSVRYQAGLLEEVRWTAGRPPGRVEKAGSGPASLPLLEVALERGVAERLDLAVGDRVLLSPIASRSQSGTRLTVEVSGVFEPLDENAPAWRYDRLVLEPGRELSASGELVAEYATALVAEPQLPALLAATTALSFEWHYPVRIRALDASNLPQVLAAVEQTTAQGLALPTTVGPLGAPPTIGVSSGLAELSGDYLERVATAGAVASLVLAGLFALALLVLGLATMLGIERRRAAIALARARGASRGQLVAVLALEVLLVTAPAGALGYALAALLVPAARPSPLSMLLVGAVVLGCLGFVSIGGLRAAGSAPGDRRRDAATPRGSKRRVSVEVLLVVLAVGGLVLLRRRGVGSGAEGGDPFLATVPVLLALSAGMFALRAYPWLLRPLVRVVGRRPGASSFVALAQAARQPMTSVLPLAVLLLGLGFSVFAAAVQTTLTNGMRDAAMAAVGADYRLDSYAFFDDQLQAVAATDGVVGTVPAFVPNEAELAEADGSRAAIRLLALDPTAYSDVAPEFAPRGGLEELAAQTPPAGTIPALVSAGVAEQARDGVVTVDLGPGVGERDVTVVGVTERFPTDEGGAFAVLDLAALRAAGDVPIRANTVFVRAPAPAASDLAATVRRFDQDVVLQSQARLLADTEQVPVVSGLVTVFRIGVLATALYCLLAVLLTMVLTAGARARLLATLRTLGLDRRRARALTALELAPMVAVVVLSGLTVGIALPYLLVPAVDLTSFTGGATAPSPRLDPYVTAALALGLVAVVAVAVAVTTALDRGRLGRDLRIGGEA